MAASKGAVLALNMGVCFLVEGDEKAGKNGAVASKGAREGDSLAEEEGLGPAGEGEALTEGG